MDNPQSRMPSFSLVTLADAAHAHAHGATPDAALQVHGIATDSRNLPRGALFVALRGDTFDGHKFVASSVAAGAAAVMVDAAGAAQLSPLQVPVLVVQDTLRALGDMAQALRRGHGKVVGVTGSNGKTTTKELVAAALSGRGAVHKTQGNFNNLIGLPLTVFAWQAPAWAAVLEMGMSAPGEIARLTEIAAPDVAMVTSIGPAHLGGPGLGTLEAVAAAKAEIFSGLQADGVAVLAVDEPLLMAAVRDLPGSYRRVRFGSDATCDVQVTRCVEGPQSIEVGLRIETTQVTCRLPLVGRHNAYNAAAAAAAAWILGISPADIARDMASVTPPPGRLQLKRHATRPLCVLDDTYNANPASARAAMVALGNAAQGMRPVAVLGDMLELGDNAEAMHRELGVQAAKSQVASLWTLGPLGHAIAEGARSCGLQAQAFTDFEGLCTALLRDVQDGDCILVKGSRGMRMERVVQALLASGRDRSQNG